MKIVEPTTWDLRSLTAGLSVIGGTGGMTGVGGGMGGAMGGGAGGGFRSIPPSGMPSAMLKSNKARQLPVSLVSLDGPDSDGRVAMPLPGRSFSSVRSDRSIATSGPAQRSGSLRKSRPRLTWRNWLSGT
jgi:hypothetical protein